MTLIPLDLAIDIFHLFQLVAQLHHGETNHSRVKAEGSSNSSLDGTGGIESHDEMMALCVSGLMLGGGFG
jgi:hypothetical protein